MKTKHIVVIGTGSVGRRHLKNLSSFGCRVSGMNPGEAKLAEARKLVDLENEYRDFNDVLTDAATFDGAVIASPPRFHIDQTIALLEAGLPVLLEKPLCPDGSGAERLRQYLAGNPGSRLLLGYTYRWWPPLRDFRKWLWDEKIGKLLHAEFFMSAHLADWHPWERYQDFFMASSELGGGALLDESHFLDLMLWFFGRPHIVYARVEKISSLDIQTDDNVDMLFRYKDGLRVTVHLDLYGRPHKKFIAVTGEEGSAEWSFAPNRIRCSSVMEDLWEEKTYDYERNDMFVELAREFVASIGQDVKLSYPIKDGIAVMRIIEACRESSRTGKEIEIDWTDK